MFSHTTLLALLIQLAARLGDEGMVFWSKAELTAIVQEVLRTWNTAALYNRDRATFQTTANQVFYDLSANSRDANSSLLLARTATDRELATDIEYALLEPPTTDWTVGWTGSDQFSMDDLTRALERRRDEWLRTTGQITSTSQQTVSSGNGRVPLSDTIIDIRRAAWVSLDDDGAEATIDNLWRVDEFTLNAQSPGWVNNPDMPSSYTILTVPHTLLQLAPPPIDVGRLHLVTVNAGGTLDTTTGTTVGIPDDYAPYLKWGAMADLLSKDGPARDETRAQYCEQRWQEGLQFAEFATSVLYAEVNGVPVPITSLMDLDTQVPHWQSDTTGEPETLILSGLHTAAFYPVPDGVYSIVCGVLRNAPLPVADADFVQIGLEYLDALLGEAQHIALFKCAGAEFNATVGLHQAFIEAASQANSKLRAQVDAAEAELDKAQREEHQRARFAA